MLNLLPNADVDFSPEPALKLSMTTYPSSTVVLKNDGDTSQFGKHLLDYVTEEGGWLINAKNSDIVQGDSEHFTLQVLHKSIPTTLLMWVEFCLCLKNCKRRSHNSCEITVKWRGKNPRLPAQFLA